MKVIVGLKGHKARPQTIGAVYTLFSVASTPKKSDGF
jgi:hypothetical protein